MRALVTQGIDTVTLDFGVAPMLSMYLPWSDPLLSSGYTLSATADIINNSDFEAHLICGFENYRGTCCGGYHFFTVPAGAHTVVTFTGAFQYGNFTVDFGCGVSTYTPPAIPDVVVRLPLMIATEVPDFSFPP